MDGSVTREELNKLSESLRTTQDSMLLMSKDVHSMNLSVASMARSLEVLVELQQNMKILEEREETRHKQLKEADKVIHDRVDSVQKALKDVGVQISNGDRAYSILVTIAKWLGASAVGVLVTLVIFVIQLQGN